ncbi:MAG TPA: hypothetical protein VMP01_26905 [Pirellulaceae bacterium]|nr:hypothetical protein [Pirellulaceae bacterium]
MHLPHLQCKLPAARNVKAICDRTWQNELSAGCGRGIAVSRVDLTIAAVALAHGLILVTHNTADYRNVPGLHLEDWLTP